MQGSRPLGARTGAAGAGAGAGAAGRRRIAGRASAEAESAAEPVLRRPSMPGAQSVVEEKVGAPADVEAAVQEGGERYVRADEPFPAGAPRARAPRGPGR